MRKILFFLAVLFFSSLQGQELNCVVTVDYSQVPNANTQIFKTLQQALNDFVNKNKWTDLEVRSNEKINCSMYINVLSYEGNNFDATIQVQSNRTAYNSTYATPLVNINDKDFSFSYVEFENLTYNPNSFDSNLMSVLAFYVYYIIGADADSMSPQGGDAYYQMAQDIVTLAAPSNIKGWTQGDKRQSRYYLMNDLMSTTFIPYREAMYTYHFEGIDKMEADLTKGKEIIKGAILKMNEINSVRPNAYLTRTFFDAKSDEIVSIFSGGPAIDIDTLVNTLNKVSPTNSSKWSKIK